MVNDIQKSEEPRAFVSCGRETEGMYFHMSIAHRGDHQNSVDHVRYVLRSDKTEGKMERLLLHNTPSWVIGRSGYEFTRERLLQLAVNNEEFEMEKRHMARGRRRMFYRMELSVGESIEAEKLMRMGKAFLTEQFPSAVGIGALHTDTEHLHIHLHLEPRQTDGYKIALQGNSFFKLDEAWGVLYAKEFGEKKYREYLIKKAETKATRRAYHEGLKEIETRSGLSESERENSRQEFKENFQWPERVRAPAERRREIERTTYANQGRVRADQRGIDRRESTIERANQLADRALREVMRLSERGERLHERERGRGR